MKTPAPKRASAVPASALPGPGSSVGVASWALGLLLAVAIFLVYWPALHGGILWDDTGHLTRPDLRSVDGLFRIWFEMGATQQYYPVLHSAFWFEQLFFGTHTTAYHVLNVLEHTTAALLFVMLLRRLQVPGAWLAAFLFALHPVCVESVAWISEQKNTLSINFYLLAALVYLRFEGSRKASHYALATFLFFLALGTKTVTSTLPAALLVIFWWQRGRLDFRRDVKPLLPWFALAIVAGITTAWVEHTLVGAENTKYDLGLVQRVLLASRIVWFYFGKLVFPTGLVFIYPRWTVDAGVGWQYGFLLALLLLAGAAWRWRAHRSPVAAGLLFIGTLFPALGFVNVYPFMFSFVADHFQYLASLAIFAAAGAGLTLLFKRWPGAAATTAGIALCAGFGLLARAQSTEYRDVITLYQSTIQKNPGAWMAYNNLGNTLVGMGKIKEALPYFEASAKLAPQNAESVNNIGYALIGLGRPEEAIPHLKRAIELRGDYVFAYNNLGLALNTLGRSAEAEPPLRTAVRLKPEYTEAHFNLGLALAQQGKETEALQEFTIALKQRPDFVEAEFNLAIGLANLKRAPESYPHFEHALAQQPKRLDIEFSYGRALAMESRLDEAMAHYREALKLAPDFAEAHFYLGNALRQVGRQQEAAEHLAEARRLGLKI